MQKIVTGFFPSNLLQRPKIELFNKRIYDFSRNKHPMTFKKVSKMKFKDRHLCFLIARAVSEKLIVPFAASRFPSKKNLECPSVHLSDTRDTNL